MVPVGNELYFFADDEVGYRQLFKSDGSTAGTNAITSGEPDQPSSLTAAGNRVFYADQDATNGNELWTSDGTPAGTEHRQGHRAGR